MFISACCLLSALPSLLQFGRGRLFLVSISFYVLSPLFGPCRLSEFTLAGPLLYSFLRLKELFQVKNGGYVVTFFKLKMQKFWVGRVTLNGEWGMEWNGTTLCYFLMPFFCSNINIIPFLFSTAGPSIGTKRSFFVPLCNSPLWEEDTCIVFIV